MSFTSLCARCVCQADQNPYPDLAYIYQLCLINFRLRWFALPLINVALPHLMVTKIRNASSLACKFADSLIFPT